METRGDGVVEVCSDDVVETYNGKVSWLHWNFYGRFDGTCMAVLMKENIVIRGTLECEELLGALI